MGSVWPRVIDELCLQVLSPLEQGARVDGSETRNSEDLRLFDVCGRFDAVGCERSLLGATDPGDLYVADAEPVEIVRQLPLSPPRLINPSGRCNHTIEAVLVP